MNLIEVGLFDDSSLIETERFPDDMFVSVVDIKNDDFVLSSAVKRKTVEVVGRVVTDADNRGGIDLPDVLDSGRAIRFSSDFSTRGVGELTLYF